MKKRNEKRHRMLAFALSLLVLFGTVMPNGIQKVSAAATPFAGQYGVSIANAAMTVIADGRIGMTLVFSGINDAAVQRGTAVVDDNSYSFTKVSSGVYSITYYLDAKDITGIRTISVQDGNTLIPLQNKNVPVIDGKAVISGSDFIDSAIELDKASGGEYTAIYQAVASYGACAKNYFDNDPKESPVSVQNVDFTAYEPALSGDLPNGITYCGSTLILEDSITLRHYFSADYTKVTDPTKYVVKVDGKTANVGYNETNELYFVDISGVVAWDIDHAYSLTIAGDSKNFTLNYSALSYAYLCANRDTDAKLVSLVKSIYWYNKAIKDYLNAHSDPETTPTPDVTPDPTITPNPTVTPDPNEPVESIYPIIEIPEMTLEEMEAITPKPAHQFTSERNSYNEVVYYEDYCAADGVTNDFPGIILAHKVANETNAKVKALRNPNNPKTFYLSTEGFTSFETAVIKTDTDWTGASFILDDSYLKAGHTTENELWYFTVKSDYEVQKGTAAYHRDASNNVVWDGTIDLFGKVHSIMRDQTSIDVSGLNLPEEGLLYIRNGYSTNFVRTGSTPEASNNGKEQMEAIILHSDGTIDSLTPVLWDYTEFTQYWYHPIDPTVLQITGGTFTTLVNTINGRPYVHRGIQILRSNVLVEGVTHILDEDVKNKDTISPYYGFFSVEEAAYVTLKDCQLSSHYKAKVTGTNTAPYDITYRLACCIYLEHITEVTDIMDGTRWGIMGTNYCKDLRANNCSMTRFDVHAGTESVTLTNSEIGILGINIVGDGLAYFDNVKCCGTHYICIRHDYGSTWHGNLVIKNAYWYVTYELNPERGNATPIMIELMNNGLTQYGYTCYLPTNVLIDGMYVDNSLLNNYPDKPDTEANETESALRAFKNAGVYIWDAVYRVSGNDANAYYREYLERRANYIQPPKNVYVRGFESNLTSKLQLNIHGFDFFYKNVNFQWMK